MLRIVLDSDVLVAAIDSPTGASRQLVTEVLGGHVCLLMSAGLMVEYRPTVLGMIGLGDAEVRDVLDERARLCIPVALDFCWRPVAELLSAIGDPLPFPEALRRPEPIP